MPASHFHITGTVQGVWFRSTAKEKADALGVKGWARNSEDGSVEIHAEGSKEALLKLEEWCWKGPAGAGVANVEVEEVGEEGLRTFVVES